MVKIAQVIVDIPLMQTDKPFSYLVPRDFEEQIAVGMRVHVPFGRSNRMLQGFIVNLSSIASSDSKTLKAISEVLDFEPVLNEEQLGLAEQMRHTVFSYKISILKSMIPSLLYSQYDKQLTPTETLSHSERLALFGKKDTRLYSSFTREEKIKVTHLIQSHHIAVTYLAKDKKTIKTEKYYHVQLDRMSTVVISNRAKKRLELLDYLKHHPEDGKLSHLYHSFSRDVVHFFITQKLISVFEREKSRSEAYFNVATTDFITLNDEQKAIVNQVSSQIGEDSVPFLLEGVTGSGKTEVYLHIIDNALKRGKTAIVLVPEISLTPQMTNRFISRFGSQVAIMHSALSDGEKFDEWRKIKSGKAKVVVGARSAIFAPVKNLGAIIIDEEHEATYKQESNPRYHARDVALIRMRYHKAVLVLGSATPSIESRARASRGVYQFLTLSRRANPKAKLPQVEIVDFRDYIGQQKVSNFTPYLLEKIGDRLGKQEQVVLMLNRRGYSSFVMCRDCGYVDSCPNCDISLTLHMDSKTMNCHYCGFEHAILSTCPSCHSSRIRYYGTGTQKAYDELASVFPKATILRMDIDTTRQKGSHQRILDKFGNHEAQILLGTQMIAKGLDFPNVTLVGVLNADTSLNLPDFRSSERTFQLLTQVAGRAGRAEKEGEVVIQTYNPQHYAIQLAQKQNYEAFYAYEMGIRKQLAYPPYYFTVALTLSHKDEQQVQRKSFELLQIVRQHLSDKAKLLGPTPKPIARTHNLYHYQLIIKYRFENNLEYVLNQMLDWAQLPEHKTFRLNIDYEPQNFM